MASPRVDPTIFKRLEPKSPKLHPVFILVLLLLHFSAAAMGSNLNFPQPYLTVNHNAKVLHLNCTLPPEAYKQWDTVYGLHIMASIDGKNSEKNVSVATLTKSQPDRGKLLDDVVGDVEGFLESGVSLKQGRPSPYLAVKLVLDSEQHGRYYCDIEHSLKSDHTTTPVYSRKVYVGKDGVEPPGGGGGEVDQFAEVKTVDAVNVTWRHPQGLEFTEAEVEKYGINSGGNPVGTRKFLFFVSEDNPDILSKTSGVLLATMVRPKDDHHNFTMTVYVEPAISLPPGFQTYYTCFVPYVGCYGEHEKLCVCSQDELQLASPIAAAATASSDTPLILGILLALSILVIIGLIVAYRLRKYRSTCTVVRSDKGDQNGALRNRNGVKFQDVNYDRVPEHDIERGEGENPVGVNNDIEHGAARDNAEPQARAKKNPVNVEIPNSKDEPLAKKDTPLVVEMPKDEPKNPHRQRANRTNAESEVDRRPGGDDLDIVHERADFEDHQNSLIDVPINKGSGATPKIFSGQKRDSMKDDRRRKERGENSHRSSRQPHGQSALRQGERFNDRGSGPVVHRSFDQTGDSNSVLGAEGGEGAAAGAGEPTEQFPVDLLDKELQSHNSPSGNDQQFQSLSLESLGAQTSVKTEDLYADSNHPDPFTQSPPRENTRHISRQASISQNAQPVVANENLADDITTRGESNLTAGHHPVHVSQEEDNLNTRGNNLISPAASPGNTSV